MRLVADSFAWPFRVRSRWTWAIGMLAVLFLPLLFIPLLGYAVAATRAAEVDASTGPPPWRWSARQLWDGAWTALAIAISVAPFALAYKPVSTLVGQTGLPEPYPGVAALLPLVFLWGVLVLTLAPHAAAKFAATSDFHDLFDVVAALRGVRADFGTWNGVVGAIVTSWAVGLACVGLLCVGLVPGIFYAILVSAHATAALHRPGSRPAAG